MDDGRESEIIVDSAVLSPAVGHRLCKSGWFKDLFQSQSGQPWIDQTRQSCPTFAGTASAKSPDRSKTSEAVRSCCDLGVSAVCQRLYRRTADSPGLEDRRRC